MMTDAERVRRIAVAQAEASARHALEIVNEARAEIDAAESKMVRAEMAWRKAESELDRLENEEESDHD